MNISYFQSNLALKTLSERPKYHVKIKKERTAKLNWQVEHPAVLDFINFLVSLSLYLFMYLLFFNKQ